MTIEEIKKRVVFEDNHLLVVEKPPGILSQSDDSGDPDLLTDCREYLRVSQNKSGQAYIGLVHRLDRNVGGVMVFAKTSKAASRLSAQVRDRIFKKRYLAIVNGLVKPERGTIKNYLKKDNNRRIAMVKNKQFTGAKLAHLDYQKLSGDGQTSLVSILLHTGRFHQIRAQFANLGFPLLGDKKYGSKKSFRGLDIALYAYSLDFLHPTTKEELHFERKPNWPGV